MRGEMRITTPLSMHMPGVEGGGAVLHVGGSKEPLHYTHMNEGI